MSQIDGLYLFFVMWHYANKLNCNARKLFFSFGQAGQSLKKLAGPAFFFCENPGRVRPVNSTGKNPFESRYTQYIAGISVLREEKMTTERALLTVNSLCSMRLRLLFIFLFMSGCVCIFFGLQDDIWFDNAYIS
jgi:hypothetical protein